MKNNIIAKTLLIVCILLLGTSIYLFSELQRYKENDLKQEKIFTEVADSLTYFRMQRDSLQLQR